MKKHSLTGIISLVLGMGTFVLYLFLEFTPHDRTGGKTAAVILGLVSIIIGLVARFSKAKDNFGVAGLALGLISLIYGIVYL